MIIEDKRTFSLTHLDDIGSVGSLEFQRLRARILTQKKKQ
jgi:hypothetical protein